MDTKNSGEVDKNRLNNGRSSDVAQRSAKDARHKLNPSAAQTKLEARFIDAQTDLSLSRQRLLRQILAEADETFYLSSRAMGRRYGVDSATIVRSVQAMGYSKFADFLYDLRNHFVTQITPYTAMKAAAQKNRSVGDYVHKSIDQDLENLNELKAGLDVARVLEMAKQINRARRIIIVGIDFAASLASSFAYGLMRLGCDSEAPTGSTGVVQNKIRILTGKDMLIAISFGQGLRETIEAVKSARRQNVPTFGITDGDSTAIARYCNDYIVASTTRSSFIDSYVAPVAAINAVLVACAHSQPKRTLKILEQFDKETASRARWYQEL